MKVVTMGVHVLDVLVRPVEEIPEGQGATLVEDIRMTAAGTAGGTALTLAKLGAEVRSAGAVGSDPTGDMLVQLLGRAGVDTEFLVRRTDTATSASVLPISASRHTVERPAPRRRLRRQTPRASLSRRWPTGFGRVTSGCSP
mgnify:CR=1 FL=1